MSWCIFCTCSQKLCFRTASFRWILSSGSVTGPRSSGAGIPSFSRPLSFIGMSFQNPAGFDLSLCLHRQHILERMSEHRSQNTEVVGNKTVCVPSCSQQSSVEFGKTDTYIHVLCGCRSVHVQLCLCWSSLHCYNHCEDDSCHSESHKYHSQYPYGTGSGLWKCLDCRYIRAQRRKQQYSQSYSA